MTGTARCLVTLFTLSSVIGQTVAEPTVRILTPNVDSCSAYVKSMETNDNPTLMAGLGGWALGFLSGVAQGTDKDILRDAKAPDLFRQLYSLCKAQPGLPLSIAAEQMARALIEVRSRR